MSLDKSLRSRGALVRHRNVLSRTERIEKLKDLGQWDDQRDVFGLPKVAHRKVTTKKIKTVAAAAAPGAEGAAAAPGAEAATGAPAKGAAVAKAAPAAKTAPPPKAAGPKAGGAKGKG
jgi:small basic protein (TIGR04137 family)